METSGIEAATVAWHPLGWEPVFFSEIEPFPCAVLKHHYPDVPNLGDMTKYKDWSVKDGAIELLVGGTPCQSFSVAGLRKGLADPRGNLALVYLGLLDHLRPSWMVWENVPGVLSSNGGKDFGAFLGGLAELGYGFAYRVLDAQYFGVPQRRRRVFVVGYFGDWRPAASVLFERESLSGDTPPRREKGERVAGGSTFGIDEECNVRRDGFGPLLRGGQGGTRQAVCYVRDAQDAHYSGTHCERCGREVPDGWDNCPYCGSSSLENTPLVMAHGQGNAEVVKDGAPSLTCNHEAPIVAMGFEGDVARTLTARYDSSPCADRGMDIVAYHRNASCAVTAQDDKTAALRSNGEHSYQFLQTASTVRRLTPRECERLQGFPDDYSLIPWRKGMAPDGPRYKALGNSMAVPVMRWIGQRLTATRGSVD